MIAVDTDRERCAEVFALRSACWQNGYRPLAVYSPGAVFRGEPIKNAGAAPVGSDWLKQAMRDPPWIIGAPQRGSPHALNTGLVTGELSGLAIDVMTQDVVDQIVSRIEEVLGPTPLSRTGNPPQILMCYRAAEPFGKISTQDYTMPDGSKAHFETLAPVSRSSPSAFILSPGSPTAGPTDRRLIRHWPSCPRSPRSRRTT